MHLQLDKRRIWDANNSLFVNFCELLKLGDEKIQLQDLRSEVIIVQHGTRTK